MIVAIVVRAPRLALLCLALLCLAVHSTGCVDPGPFPCTTDAQCGPADTGARCEPSGDCSFADANCPSGRRFGEHAARQLADACVARPVVCGDGLVEGAETCDPPAACPTTCDDGNACTVDWVLGGSPETCDVACGNEVQATCGVTDGCCPPACGPVEDLDCVDCRDPLGWRAGWTAFEAAAIDRLNYWRGQQVTCVTGVVGPSPILTVEPALAESSRCHALDMAAHDFYDEVGSDGSDSPARAEQAGFAGTVVGGLIARGYADPVVFADDLIQGGGDACALAMRGEASLIGMGFAENPAATHARYIDLVLGRP